MLDVGHIISSLGRTSTTSDQAVTASSTSVPATPITIQTQAEPVYVTSRIRVDNLQDVAILEYRSEDGEVKDQFPTQKQIEAFNRTQQSLDATRSAAASIAESSTPAAPQPQVEVNTGSSESSSSAAPAVPTPTVSAPAAPVTPTVSAPATPAPAAPSVDTVV